MAKTFNYDRATKTADRLIKKFGQAGAIMKYQAPANKGDKPTYVPQLCSLVILDYADNLIDGTNITAKDRQIYVSAKGPTPTLDDRIRDAAGNVYEIRPPLGTLNPGGTVVLYDIQGRL